MVVLVLVLGSVGVLLGGIEAFLVPQRVFGVLGFAAALALVGNLVAGTLAGIGTRSIQATLIPVMAWFVTVGVLSAVSIGPNSVVIAGKLPEDPGVVAAGEALLIAGIVGGALALVVTAYFTKRAKAPTAQA
jgi:hypothetical protein